ncbi:hypothetical protein AKJ52_01100 [candidate division MSBL1 archaeon SCGC-AAA382C18]|uniref:Haloacid dehalogenase n=1 Tax=candidate division MSBL1 archaeon SCGC-AAA382C18 TaxID=1698281 RepID=A0A133VKR3_9EURY|nr:hypothetical protein AKJ52_01100 [candidate division MSBL1 archaeon SCGC-AAA382C18]
MEKALLSFDLDGTLVKPDLVNRFWFEEVPRLFAKNHDLDFDEAVVFVKNRYEEVGSEDIRWYKPEYWFDRFGIDEKPSSIVEGIFHEVSYYQDALDLLEKVSDEHELIVTSNAHRIFLDVQLRDIRDYFSRIFSSVSDMGSVKKDPRVYEKVCEKVGVEPKDMVHIGDNKVFDYESPRELGIRTFLVDRNGGMESSEYVVKDLRKILEKI